MIAAAALAAGVLNVAVGLTLLGRWLGRHRAAPGPGTFPPPLVFVHLATALVTLAIWTVYLATDRPTALAWSAFALLTLVNALGDLLMTRGWRARQRHAALVGRTGARDYLAAAGDTLSGRRPTVLAHALLAPATYVLVLLAALGVGS